MRCDDVYALELLGRCNGGGAVGLIGVVDATHACEDHDEEDETLGY